MVNPIDIAGECKKKQKNMDGNSDTVTSPGKCLVFLPAVTVTSELVCWLVA